MDEERDLVVFEDDAGNELTMPGSPGDFRALLRGLKDGTVTRRQLCINASRIVRLAKTLTE